jgi:DNA-binding transcriptional LysR family regulator
MHLRMDWRSVKFDWNRARAFLVTAEEGSLSAAARALGMTQPTLGRQVDALEQELGVVLFERAGRGLVLTPSGLELLDHVREMGVAANKISLAASGQSQEIEGTISISASEAFSVYILPPIIERLRREQPGISVQIVGTNTTADLQRREADIAIRNFRPEQPDLIAKKVSEEPAGFWATPAYLDRVGHPKFADDMSGVHFIGFESAEQMSDYFVKLGLKLAPSNFVVSSANHMAQWACVKQGLGIGVMTDRIAEMEPGVMRAIPDMQPIVVPVWLTAHREVSTSRRVRLVFDMLAEELGRLS